MKSHDVYLSLDTGCLFLEQVLAKEADLVLVIGIVAEDLNFPFYAIMLFLERIHGGIPRGKLTL